MRTLMALPLLLLLTAFSAQAGDCTARNSIGIALVATTFVPQVSLDGNHIPQIKDLSELQRVCVDFDAQRNVKGIEYLNLLDPTKRDYVPFSELAHQGHQTFRDSPFGKLLVSETTCTGCREGSTRMTLTLGMLHSYRLIGKNSWVYPQITISFIGDVPVADYKGTPFNVITLRAEGGVGGGVKQVRFSRCESGNACVLSSSSPLRHLTQVTF